MTTIISNMWRKVSSPLFNAQHDKRVGDEAKDVLHEVDKAKKEWLTAHQYFSVVTEPELVDHAIMVCQAAEQKYQYLLRVAKRQGLINGTLPIHTATRPR